MKSQKILYIGNNLRGNNTNVTTIETLSLQLQSIGYEVVCYSSVKNKFLRIIDMLVGVLKHGRTATAVLIDTYSTQNFYYAVAVANLCRLLRIPYIPILHGGNLPERLQRSKSNSYKLFNGAKTNVAPSSYLLNAFRAHGYTKIVHIPNTIPIKSYPFLLRNQVGPRLLWVRSFAEIYNPMLALRLVEHLRIKFPEMELCMIGPEKDGAMEACKSYAEQHQLPVTFTGKLSKEAWREKSKDFDVFINTTNFDNTPVSLIEAMALGLPIISTNVGGIPNLITNEKDGLLVAPDDVNAMAKALELICARPELANKISMNARRKAESFDWEIVKQDWLNLLNE